MECFCSLRNIQDKLADGQSPYETRNSTPFDCPIVPFGSGIFFSIQSVRKTKVVFINVVQRCFQEYSSETLSILEDVGSAT